MALLLTQMAVVLFITVACGWLALKVGQARVIVISSDESRPGRRSLGVLLPHFPPNSFPSVRWALSKPSLPSAWAVPLSHRNGT